VAGEAKNALLVPVQALRELSSDQYAVFVVGVDGELELRPVEVGLQDYVNAEIRSGLQQGEVVSVGGTTGSSGSLSGQASTDTMQSPPDAGPGGPAGGMMPMFGG
jgi:hypothetical protein